MSSAYDKPCFCFAWVTGMFFVVRTSLFLKCLCCKQYICFALEAASIEPGPNRNDAPWPQFKFPIDFVVRPLSVELVCCCAHWGNICSVPMSYLTCCNHTYIYIYIYYIYICIYIYIRINIHRLLFYI